MQTVRLFHFAFDQRAIEVSLGGEMLVENRLRYANGSGQLARGDTAKTPLGEEVVGSRQDRFPAFGSGQTRRGRHRTSEC